jgi:hypothetical protein
VGIALVLDQLRLGVVHRPGERGFEVDYLQRRQVLAFEEPDQVAGGVEAFARDDLHGL